MHNPWLMEVTWSILTIGLYVIAKRLHKRFPTWWTSPLMVAPSLLLLIAVTFRVGYDEYSHDTHWLVALLGPAMVAFAIPIYRKRFFIQQHWPLLLVGVIAGSITSFASSWFLARWLGLDGYLALSLMPRSMSTPFAMIVSTDIGGVPSLTAVFVLLTGVIGAAVGELLLKVLPLRSSLARGALFGMGAHGAGTARALQIDSEVGSIAGLVMVFVGLLNVLAAPFLGSVMAQLH